MRISVNSEESTDRVIPLHEMVPGRIRFSVPKLYREKQFAAEVQNELVQREGIVRAVVNSLTGSILVIFRPKKLSSDAVRRLIQDILDIPHSSNNGLASIQIPWHT